MIVLNLGIDTRSKEGRLMVTIRSGLAEIEQKLLIERTRKGVVHARAEGCLPGPKSKLPRKRCGWHTKP